MELVELEGETAVVTRALPDGVGLGEWLEASFGPPPALPEPGEKSEVDQGSDYSAYFRVPVVEEGKPPDPPPPPPVEETPPAEERPPTGPPSGGSDYTAFFGLPAVGDTPSEPLRPPTPQEPPPVQAAPPPPKASPSRPTGAPLPGPTPPPGTANPPPPGTAAPPPPTSSPPRPPPEDSSRSQPKGPDYTREFGSFGVPSEPERTPPPDPGRRDSRTPGYGFAPKPEPRSPSPEVGKMWEGGEMRRPPSRGGDDRDLVDPDSESITQEFRKPRVPPRPEPSDPEPRGWSQPPGGRAPQAMPLRDYLSRLDQSGEGQTGARRPPQDPPQWRPAPPSMRPGRPGVSEPTVMSPLRPPEEPRQSQAGAAPPSPQPSGGKGGGKGLRTKDIVILVSVVGIAVVLAVAAVLFLFLRGD